jgi:hypothetical protein
MASKIASNDADRNATMILLLGSTANHLTHVCSGGDVQPDPQLPDADMRAAGI